MTEVQHPPPVCHLLRVLETGNKGKEVLDAVIDGCSAMQNIREAIVGYRGLVKSAGQDEKRRNASLHRCIEYLDRYFVLVAFSAYVFGQEYPRGRRFAEWVAERPELASISKRMLRRDPMAASCC